MSFGDLSNFKLTNDELSNVELSNLELNWVMLRWVILSCQVCSENIYGLYEPEWVTDTGKAKDAYAYTNGVNLANHLSLAAHLLCSNQNRQGNDLDYRKSFLIFYHGQIYPNLLKQWNIIEMVKY